MDGGRPFGQTSLVSDTGGEAKRFRDFLSERWFWSGLTLASQALAVYLALQVPVNQLAYAIVQAVAVLAGIVTAQQWSRYSVKDAAAEMVRPYASASIRHLVTLGKSIATTQRRISEEIGLLAGDGTSETVPRQSVEIIARAAVDGLQVSLDIAADATESWRDVAPETVRRYVDEPSENPGV